MLKKIIKNLYNKSNIDYHYYHLFQNNLLNLNFSKNNFTINYIVYIIDSDFSLFLEFLKNNNKEIFSDLFFEKIKFSDFDVNTLSEVIFNKLFWIRFNQIDFKENDFEKINIFLQNNQLDINRIFFENCNLNEKFFEIFSKNLWFSNLTFLNFDNNFIWNSWLNLFYYFLKNNKINLEYLSLINSSISDFNILKNYLEESKIRILDISWNNILNSEIILEFIERSQTIRELYLKNIYFEDIFLEKIFKIFENKKTNIYFLRFSISEKQEKFLEKFKKLEKNLWIYFDIDFIKNEKIFSTIYFKAWDENLKKLESDYFYFLDENNLDVDFNEIILKKDNFLKNWINLFLFDFHCYKKIKFLLDNYVFNYIYIENYFISDNDFIYFLDIIKNNFLKKYKINLISIEISEFQLDYLINNLPENIFYIEVNLNKIEKNREKYIYKMLQNKAFIFENMDLYKKIFK